MDNHNEIFLFQDTQSSCTYDLMTVMTTCMRSSKDQARQNPSLKWRDGREDPPHDEGILAIIARLSKY